MHLFTAMQLGSLFMKAYSLLNSQHSWSSYQSHIDVPVTYQDGNLPINTVALTAEINPLCNPVVS